MQDPKNMRKGCDTCGADPNQPCITVDGYIAERVHWGRGSPPRCKIVGRSKELDFFLYEFTVIADLIDRDWNYLAEDGPTLFPGTDICADCGESYSRPGLVRRCQERHRDRSLV